MASNMNLLHPDHLSDLRKSGLSDETIRAAGIYSARPCDITKILGFNPKQVNSALIFPYHGIDFVRLKIFPTITDEQGHRVKYLQRRGSDVHLYVPPGVGEKILDKTVPLYVTEGEKKALRAAQDGFCCLGLGGIWNWKNSGSDDPISEITNLPLSGRAVFLIPDSDWEQNENVRLAVYRLGVAFKKLDAIVEVICLLQGDNGTKTGLDDFFITHSRSDFETLEKISLERFMNNNTSVAKKSAEETPPWEVPIPFSSHRLPAFPIDSLPTWLRSFVTGLSIATQTPPDMAGLLSLAACAMACAKKVAVLIRQGWIEALNIYALIALKPGSRKSVVFSRIEGPIIKYEQEISEAAAPAIAIAENEYKILSGKLQYTQTKASKAIGADTEKFKREASDIAKQLAGSKVPATPRLVVDDITPERLAAMLKDQDGRLAVMSAEGGIFDIMAGRYSDGAPNFEVYLKGHAGDTIRVDRVGRSPEFIDCPALTMALTVQPEVLAGLIRKQGFRGRGLLGRILYSIPPDLLGRRQINAPPLPETARRAYHEGLRRLLDLPLEKDDKGYVKSALLRFSPEAATRFREFESWVEPQLLDFGALGFMTDWGGKLAGAVARICGILHMAENLENVEPWNISIARETVERAIRLGEYLIPHARAAYAAMGADPAIEDAKRVLDWIRREGLDNFSKRDIFNSLRGYFKRVLGMEPALAILQEHGFIRLRASEPKDRAGRKSSPVYEVNPFFLTSGGNSADCAYSAYEDDGANS